MAVSRSQTSFPLVALLQQILPFQDDRQYGNLAFQRRAGCKDFGNTADVVGNKVYKNILLTAANEVKGGSSISEALSKYPEIPLMVVQMIKTGEETGKLNFMLKTLGRFYKKEVDNAVRHAGKP